MCWKQEWAHAINNINHLITHVEKAIEKGYVHPEAVLRIEGVPHAQIIKL